jgi:hypothetical protein
LFISGGIRKHDSLPDFLAELCVPVRIAQVGKSGALGDTGLIVLFVAVLIGVVLVVVFRKKNRKLIFIFLFYS